MRASNYIFRSSIGTPWYISGRPSIHAFKKIFTPCGLSKVSRAAVTSSRVALFAAYIAATSARASGCFYGVEGSGCANRSSTIFEFIDSEVPNCDQVVHGPVLQRSDQRARHFILGVGSQGFGAVLSLDMTLSCRRHVVQADNLALSGSSHTDQLTQCGTVQQSFTIHLMAPSAAGAANECLILRRSQWRDLQLGKLG